MSCERWNGATNSHDGGDGMVIDDLHLLLSVFHPAVGGT